MSLNLIKMFVNMIKRNNTNIVFQSELSFLSAFILFDFSLTVKAAPHECVIRTGQP